MGKLYTMVYILVFVVHNQCVHSSDTNDKDFEIVLTNI